MKLGVIDAGGGTRGMYGAGVFDYCIEKDIRFDYGIGISAGAANLCSYMSGQFGRNYSFYYEYAQRKEYMSLRNFLKTRNYVGLDYIYTTLSARGGENALDFAAMEERAREMKFFIGATNATTGQAHHFTIEDMWQDHYDPLKASCCVPGACRAYEIDGIPYYDGALSAPIPVQKALADGCDKIVLVLTRPRDTVRDAKKDCRVARLIACKYPAAAEAFRRRADKYNESVALAKRLEKDGRALIVAPDSIEGLGTLSVKPEAIHELYLKGLKDARAITRFIAD